LTANIKATPGTIALVSVLVMMETIMNQQIFKWMASWALLMAWATIADGELSALAWLPMMVV
jgi:hypothetical protein